MTPLVPPPQYFSLLGFTIYSYNVGEADLVEVCSQHLGISISAAYIRFCRDR